MIIAEFSITPIGTGSTSVSKYVKAAHTELKKLGIHFEAGAMSTTLEARTLDEIFLSVKKAEEAMIKQGAKRLAIYLKVDDRRDKEATIKSKIEAVK